MASVSLLINMVFNTSSVRAATWAGTTPAATAFPAIDKLAARAVERTNSSGAPARATS